MSQENVEMVERMYAAYLAGEAQRSLAYFHPEVAADFSIRGDSRPTVGREALGETVFNWLSAWDDYSEEIEEIRDLGDYVLVTATQRARGKGSGIEIENRWGQIYRVEDGMITEVTMYRSPEEAQAAVREPR
jgi:ketosteroid isomerase-like protein